MYVYIVSAAQHSVRINIFDVCMYLYYLLGMHTPLTFTITKSWIYTQQLQKTTTV